MVDAAEVIVRAEARSYLKPPPATGILLLSEPDDIEIAFAIKEVLKGTAVPPAIVLNGYLTDRDDFNDRAVPYNFVRPGGRGGPCNAYQYKKGAEFLLFLKKIDGKYTIRWYALAPTNEQLRSGDDPWLEWTRVYLKNRKELGARVTRDTTLCEYSAEI